MKISVVVRTVPHQVAHREGLAGVVGNMEDHVVGELAESATWTFERERCVPVELRVKEDLLD